MYGIVNKDFFLFICLYMWWYTSHHYNTLYNQLFSRLKTILWSMCVFSTVLNYIMNNLTNPLDSTQATAERIAQDLMSSNTGLKELEEALKQAEKAVTKTILMNVGNEEVLSNIMVLLFVFHKGLNNDIHINLFTKLQFIVLCPQNHRMMFENKQDDIWSDLAMIRGALRDTKDLQTMMNNLQNVRVWYCNVISVK